MEVDLLSFQRQLKTRSENNIILIWDPVRKNYFELTPEEMVRQLLILFFNQTWNIPFSHMSAEKEIQLNKKRLRFDLVLFRRKVLKPLLLAELKKPSIPIDQKVFDQLSAYQQAIQSPYLLASNGRQTRLVATRNNGEYDELLEWPKDLRNWGA